MHLTVHCCWVLAYWLGWSYQLHASPVKQPPSQDDRKSVRTKRGQAASAKTPSREVHDKPPNIPEQSINGSSTEATTQLPFATREAFSSCNNTANPRSSQPSTYDKASPIEVAPSMDQVEDIQIPRLEATPQYLRNPIWTLCKKFPKVFAKGIHPLAPHDFKCNIQLFDEPRMLKPY